MYTGPIAASEEQAEMQLERTLQMFRFLQEKDMFEKYYKQVCESASACVCVQHVAKHMLW